MENVTIIGGGTAGLFLARELKKRKISSVIYEEHKELGEPVHDTGIFSKNMLEFVPDLEKMALNTVKGAKLFSPGGKVVELARAEDEAYILDRHKLEKNLAKGLDVEVGKRIGKIDFKTKYIFGCIGKHLNISKPSGFP